MDIQEYFSLAAITPGEALLRMALACLLGFFIGLDRERKDKPIDFRAYMIVAVTSCLLALVGIEIYAEYRHAEGMLQLDLGKIIEGILTGIGFLGAGAIIRQGDQVVGTATGASIWAAGGIRLLRPCRHRDLGYYGCAYCFRLLAEIPYRSHRKIGIPESAPLQCRFSSTSHQCFNCIFCFWSSS